MSDLISRKALVGAIEKHCYPIRYDRCSEEKGMTVTGIIQAINEQPTDFDLESAVDLFERYKLQQSENDMLSDNGKWLAQRIIEECEKIIKSAANTTNWKNGE